VERHAGIWRVNNDVDPAFVVVHADDDGEDAAAGRLEAEESRAAAGGYGEEVSGFGGAPCRGADVEGLLDEGEGVGGVVHDTDIDGVGHFDGT